MEIDFREPDLYLYTLIHSKDRKDELREYLVGKLNLAIYKKCIDSGVLAYNKRDLDHMNLEIKKKLNCFESKKREDPENESFIFEVNKQLCEFYAQTFDMENFEMLSAKLIEKDCTPSLKMDIFMCKIRMSIILQNRVSLIINVEDAQSVFESSCDWDRKNRFKVYLGLFYLIKAEFSNSAVQFSECLASFDARELLSFDRVILYLVFCSLQTFSRNDIKRKIIDNSEVRKCREVLALPECLYNCCYPEFFGRLLEFIELTENDTFLSQFREHFCKEMKIRGYHQLLLSYQSLHLTKMAQMFNAEESHVEDELCNFINEGRLPCSIDKVEGVVRMREVRNDDDLRTSLEAGEDILRSIKKCTN